MRDKYMIKMIIDGIAFASVEHYFHYRKHWEVPAFGGEKKRQHSHPSGPAIALFKLNVAISSHFIVFFFKRIKSYFIVFIIVFVFLSYFLTRCYRITVS